MSCETAPVPSWTFCAAEDQHCSFTGTAQVRYGAGGQWVERTVSDGIDCSNAVFAGPAYGVVKGCEVLR